MTWVCARVSGSRCTSRCETRSTPSRSTSPSLFSLSLALWWCGGEIEAFFHRKRLGDLMDVLRRAHEGCVAAEAGSVSSQSEGASARPAVVVRTAYILGNLTAGNARNRRLIGLEKGGVAQLVNMLPASAESLPHMSHSWIYIYIYIYISRERERERVPVL